MSTADAGQQYYDELQKQAIAQVGSQFHTKLYPVKYPEQGDFFWNYKNIDDVYNKKTIDYINANVSPAKDISGLIELSSASGFPNRYNQVLTAIAYTLNTTDAQKLKNAQSNASIQQNAIVSDYQNTFGTITSDQEKVAGVSNKCDYVMYIAGAVWSGRDAAKKPPLSYSEMAQARSLKKILPYAPMSADQVITDISVYLNIMQPVLAFEDSLSLGSWTINQLKNNTSYPTDANGGIHVFDPITGKVFDVYSDGYAINKSVEEINNGLQNTSNSISIAMKTSQSSGNEVNVHIDGQTGFSVGSWLKFTTSLGAEYDMSKSAGTSTDCSVKITWGGYVIVPFGSTAWAQDTNVGWYDKDPIYQAVKNGTQDITGYKFVSSVGYNMQSFAQGGEFGYLDNLLISNYPTIEITYQNADFSKFKQSWSEKVSGNLKLFGFISLGSFSEGAYGSSYEAGSSNSSFTIKFSASPEVTSVPQYQKTAFVIGGTLRNPGVD